MLDNIFDQSSSESTMPASIAQSGDVVELAENGDARRSSFYPGGKAQPGVYHTIINQIPRHERYIELFAGNAAIARFKKSCTFGTLLIDLDPKICDALRSDDVLRSNFFIGDLYDLKILNTDGAAWLADQNLRRREFKNFPPFVYLDPPYLKSTRRSKTPIYDFEFWTDTEHADLLQSVLNLSDSAKFMISGYRSDLYDSVLAKWRRVDFTAIDRAGNKRIESIWMNYAQPVELHDYRYLGADFRERERIKKQQRNMTAKLLALPELERNALIDVLRDAVAKKAAAARTAKKSDVGPNTEIAKNGDNTRRRNRADIAENGELRSTPKTAMTTKATI